MAVKNTINMFREEIDPWIGSYSRVMASYMAMRTADDKLLLLCATLVFGTEIDIPNKDDVQIRDKHILAGWFRVDSRKSSIDLLNEAIQGRLEAPGLKLAVATGDSRGVTPSINPSGVDSTKGNQLYKLLWLNGATLQELFQQGYDPNSLTERLQTLRHPFKTFKALAKHVNIPDEYVDRGSLLVVAARSPARIEPESRLSGEEATVKFSLGKKEDPGAIRLGYVVARGNDEIPGDADLSGKVKRNNHDGAWEGNVTFPVGKADNVKVYLSRENRKIGEVDLFPTRTAEIAGRKPKRRGSGKVFESIFDTYTGTGSQREGATGYVLKVKDDDGETWALKYLKPDRMNSKRAKRFRHEMAFCFGFRHDSIVRVIDWGGVEVDKKIVPFYVMPFYEKNLRNLIDAGIGKNDVIPLFLELIEGLARVHEREIIHRDIKPENILYDETAEKLIMADFGVAHFAEEDLYTAVETKFDDRPMNFKYAAPEQKEKNGKVELQADIWAMGLILNEMFTKTLSTGNNAPTIEQFAPEYAYLDEVVKVMTNFSPLERPRSFTEVRRLIRDRSPKAS